MLVLKGKNIIDSAAKLVIFALFLLMSAGMAQAQLAPLFVDPDDIVASVDGVGITERELAFAAEDMAQDLQSIPQGEQKAFLVGILIDMKLMANEARKLELNQSDVFALRLRYLEERALRRAFFATQINQNISDEDVRAAYEKLIAEQAPEEQLRARHILLASLEDAQGVKAELDAGANFEDMAREKSTGPSGPSGGDLGFFSRGQMVSEFEDAVFALEVGEVSEPVQTQFGWHIIKLEEKRQSEPPAFEQVAVQVRQQLLIERFDSTVEQLKSLAQIEISDPRVAEALEQRLGN
ncbi:MAG: peptidylprolyl isomerase [Devosiaceae bacterium]|nr:peptidylprolyl isomerase [Devosiaceae bacterium]